MPTPLTIRPEFSDTLLGASLAIRAGQLTCRELFERCQVAVCEQDSEIQAWVRFGGVDLERLAAERDAELRQGAWRGPLHGIPVGVKDIYDVAGQPTLAGIPHRVPEPACTDSTMVARLRDAGAIIVGKTVTTPHAFFDPPVTRNPWNRDRTPGGSSSGSAAAVASGMCLGALGSQTGGSITRPASFCGIAGYKPTFGLLSRKGMFPFSPSLDHPGPMARTVEDLAVLMMALAPRRHRSAFRELLSRPSNEEIEVCEKLPGGEAWTNQLDLLWLEEGLAEKSDPEMTSAMQDLASRLTQQGVCVGSNFMDELDLPRLWRSHRTIMAVEIATSQEARLKAHPEEFTPAVRGLIEEGLAYRAVEYAAARQFQLELRRRVRAAIGNQIWLCPAARGPAPTPETTGDPCMNSPWSFLGFPTITFPMSLSRDGLPLGLQLIAAPGQDVFLFHAARWCERRLRHSSSFDEQTASQTSNS